MNSDGIQRDFTTLVEQADKQHWLSFLLAHQRPRCKSLAPGWVLGVAFGLAFTVSPLMSDSGHKEVAAGLHSFSVTQDRLIDLFPASSL